MRLGAALFCVAGAALGAPQVRLRGGRSTYGASPARFAWQAQHLEHLRFVCVAGAALMEHLRLVLRGRRSTWSSFTVRGSPATSDAFGRRLVLRGRRSTWSTSGSFAWRAQEHLRLVLRGRRSTWSTSGSFLRGRHSTWSSFTVRGSPATSDAFGRRLVLRGMRSTWSTSGSFCVACAALGAPQVRFAWQAQHLDYLRLVLRGRRSTWSTSGSFFASHAQHLHGAPSQRSAEVRRQVTRLGAASFCVAGAALGAPQVRFLW